jgi:hypothetical protein
MRLSSDKIMSLDVSLACWCTFSEVSTSAFVGLVFNSNSSSTIRFVSSSVFDEIASPIKLATVLEMDSAYSPIMLFTSSFNFSSFSTSLLFFDSMEVFVFNGSLSFIGDGFLFNSLVEEDLLTGGRPMLDDRMLGPLLSVLRGEVRMDGEGEGDGDGDSTNFGLRGFEALDEDIFSASYFRFY